MAPVVSGSQRVPRSVVKTARSPPMSGPSTTPGTTGLPTSRPGDAALEQREQPVRHPRRLVRELGDHRPVD